MRIYLNINGYFPCQMVTFIFFFVIGFSTDLLTTNSLGLLSIICPAVGIVLTHLSYKKKNSVYITLAAFTSLTLLEPYVGIPGAFTVFGMLALFIIPFCVTLKMYGALLIPSAFVVSLIGSQGTANSLIPLTTLIIVWGTTITLHDWNNRGIQKTIDA